MTVIDLIDNLHRVVEEHKDLSYGSEILVQANAPGAIWGSTEDIKVRRYHHIYMMKDDEPPLVEISCDC